MIFGIPTWLFAVLIFMILIIISLGAVLLYMLFFKKVQVVVFGANGMPPEIKKASKKGNRLYIGRRANLPIYKNYLQQGKKRIYFAVKIDEITYIPYNLVDRPEKISEADAQIDKIIEQEKTQFEKTLKTLNKNYSKNQIKLEKLKEILENVQDKIAEFDKKYKAGDEKFFFFFSIEKQIKSYKKQERRIQKKIKVVEDKLKEIEKLNKKELTETDKKKFQKKVFGVLPSLDVDYDWLSVVADAYEEGAKRFEFGIARFAPIIAVVVVAVMCIVGTIMVVKYNTDMSPIEAEAYADFGDDLAVCAQYFTEFQKAQNEAAKTQNQNQEANIPS